jgi:hypothetical protein
MGRVYQCCCRICREINVFSMFEYHMFYVLYPFVTCLLTVVILSHDRVTIDGIWIDNWIY